VNFLDHADEGAVVGRDAGEIIDHLQAAGADHVLRHERRLARNVAAHMARHEACDGVVFAAGADPDQHRNGLAAIEIGHRIGSRAQRQEARECERRARESLSQPGRKCR